MGKGWSFILCVSTKKMTLLAQITSLEEPEKEEGVSKVSYVYKDEQLRKMRYPITLGY